MTHQVQAAFELFGVNLIVYVLLLRVEEDGRNDLEAEELVSVLDSSLLKSLDILKIKTEQLEYSGSFLETQLLVPLLEKIKALFGSPGVLCRLKELIDLPIVTQFLSQSLGKESPQKPASRKGSLVPFDLQHSLTQEKKKSAKPEPPSGSRLTRENIFFDNFIKPNEQRQKQTPKKPASLEPKPKREDLSKKIEKAKKPAPKIRSIKVVLNRSKTTQKPRKGFNCQSTIDQSYQEILNQESRLTFGKKCPNSVKPDKESPQAPPSVSEFVFDHDGLQVQANWDDRFADF